MAQRILINDQWYVAATASRADEKLQVLKHDETFALFDRFGDFAHDGPGEQGLYHEDTRYLSHEELAIEDVRPLYLGSSVQERAGLAVVELMNPDIGRDGSGLAKGTLHLFRAKLLWKGACQEHIRATNFGLEPVATRIELSFDADFADLFEVRGMQRVRRGERGAPQHDASGWTIDYRGLDDVVRRTRVSFDPAPSRRDGQRAEFDLRLQPGHAWHLYVTIACERPPCGMADEEAAPGEPPAARPGAPPTSARGPAAAAATGAVHGAAYAEAMRCRQAAQEAAEASRCSIETSNPLVDLWLDRSRSDLAMLTTELPSGPFPYAGVPWYSTAFGRDGILTARQMLWLDPSLARGVLGFLAAAQAEASDSRRDAEPGKILHEARRGEMAATHEVPFGCYYGSVDSTPLFVALAGAYWRRSGDLEFVRSIWPNVLRALEWIDRDGDADRDGFVEYSRRSADGLLQQGWKDSQDSVFHADGSMAEPPIALAEVQGYVHEARRLAADLAEALGDGALAARLRGQARELKTRFRRAFWSEAIGSYAIALDGRKRRCEVATSNAGHVLWSGIAQPDHAARTAAALMNEASFSGWGIRTVAAGQARYNPMSYHNGSVWPHDTALAAAGLARYGHTGEAMRLFAGLFDASLRFEQHRLPELFCGFHRRAWEGPVLYPVACSPQAWACAAGFCMLQACLGLEIDAAKCTLTLRAPRLPPFIDWLRIGRLQVGAGSVDLLLQRYANNVGIEVTRNEGEVTVGVTL